MVDYLAIGHVTADERPGGAPLLGGAAAYGARTAVALDLTAGIVTRGERGFLTAERLPGVDIHCQESPSTTSFVNRYRPGGEREQLLTGLALPIDATDVPARFHGARILNVAPVMQEVSCDVVVGLGAELVCITAQGWTRQAEVGGYVTAVPLAVPDWCCDLVDVIVVSDEDLAADPDAAERLARKVPLVVVTFGADGARALRGSEVIDQPALPARTVDPTGAGDVFAAALAVGLWETGELKSALRLGAAAAAASVEAAGSNGVAARAALEARLLAAEDGGAT